MGDIIASINANVKDLGERKILIMHEEGNSSRSRGPKQENKDEMLCASGVAEVGRGLIPFAHCNEGRQNVWVQAYVLARFGGGRGANFLVKARVIPFFVKSSFPPTGSHSLPLGGNFLIGIKKRYVSYFFSLENAPTWKL